MDAVSTLLLIVGGLAILAMVYVTNGSLDRRVIGMPFAIFGALCIAAGLFNVAVWCLGATAMPCAGCS